MQLTKCSLKLVVCIVIIASAFIGCTSLEKKPVFNPKTCLKEKPVVPGGIIILNGSRTKINIAHNMQPIYCHGQVLFKNMNVIGQQVNEGTVWFKIIAEYNGEVITAKIIKSEIKSKQFKKKVLNIILNTDFSSWKLQDEDAEFIYPLTFKKWWK